MLPTVPSKGLALDKLINILSFVICNFWQLAFLIWDTTWLYGGRVSTEARLVLNDHLLATNSVICIFHDYDFLRFNRCIRYMQVSLWTPWHGFPSFWDNLISFQAGWWQVLLFRLSTLHSQALPMDIELAYQLILRIQMVELFLGFYAFFRNAECSGMFDALAVRDISRVYFVVLQEI